ncbi:hypothetical protein [Bradyrhizobium sacchari]|uniref:hypothetical protein n=1 Tax=Bradyrhizobium sacchari TaxID=1399419 RepID=UPI001FD9B65A|nr:hypothetical protein [Bradyrhizobium sacchari]
MISAAARDGAGEARFRLLGYCEKCHGIAELEKAEPEHDEADQNNRYEQNYR